ncbi:MAG: hypothetical protein KDB90_16490 [Planctomycetes bacterium]|nr:hypothetical protein [Planctomycetota bacterium]
MGSARDFIRVKYSESKSMHAVEEQFDEEVSNEAFEGKWYRVVDEVRHLGSGKVRIKTVSTVGELEVGVMTFDLNTGNSTIEWLNEDPESP